MSIAIKLITKKTKLFEKFNSLRHIFRHSKAYYGKLLDLSTENHKKY